MRRSIIIALAALPILATQAHAEEVRPYSAQETVRRAQVGTSSPRRSGSLRRALRGHRTARSRRAMTAWIAGPIRRARLIGPLFAAQ